MEKETLFDVISSAYPVIPSNQLLEEMDTTIVPYLNSCGTVFDLKAKDGNPIHGMMYTCEKPKGTIAISHGFTESILKFREIIYYFLQNQYNVCIWDHRGHGYSRTVIGGPTHVNKFQDYIDDFKVVVDTVLVKQTKPYYLFAHSMGGLIGSTFIQQNPKVFTKAVLSSPLFEINTGGAPRAVAKSMAGVLCKTGKKADYLPGQGTFSSTENFEASAATCYERYLTYFKCQLADEHLQSNGSSCSWVYESFKAIEKILKNCSSIQIPVLLFQADKDDFVCPGGQDQFISTIQNGREIFVPASKHEIYLSDDKTVGTYLSLIFEFLK